MDVMEYSLQKNWERASNGDGGRVGVALFVR